MKYIENLNLSLENGLQLWKKRLNRIDILYQPKEIELKSIKNIDSPTLVFIFVNSLKIDKIMLDEDVYYSIHPTGQLISIIEAKPRCVKVIVSNGYKFFYLSYRYQSNNRYIAYKLVKGECCQILDELEISYSISKIKGHYRLFDFACVESIRIKYLIYLILHTDISYFNLDNIRKLLHGDLHPSLQTIFWSYLGNYPIVTDNYLVLNSNKLELYEKEIGDKSMYLKYLKGYKIVIQREDTHLIKLLTRMSKKATLYQSGIYDLDLICIGCGNKGFFSEILDNTYNICKICLQSHLSPEERKDKWSKILAYEKKCRVNGYIDRDIWQMRERNK